MRISIVFYKYEPRKTNVVKRGILSKIALFCSYPLNVLTILREMADKWTVVVPIFEIQAQERVGEFKAGEYMYSRISISRTRISRILRSLNGPSKLKKHFDCFHQQ